ncbi:MAG: CAF17-like 4Fe-4S cluster assembly/insertion protein YgfZ [Actinomycetota bacterium]
MSPLTPPADELAALDRGLAWVDLSEFRKVRVGGHDARAWLHDLVTTDVASLGPWDSRRTLLLDPTGHIRADLHVAFDGEGFWLLQPSDQEEHIGEVLGRYVLSSDVQLEDRSASTRLIALPGLPDGRAATGFRPSVLGDGVDLLTDLDDEGGAPLDERVQVGPEAVEVWRIRRGVARMGPDFDRTSIPAEADLSSVIDATKGCFLGQESVARVRNLGHPPRVLRHLVTAAPVDTGSEVFDDRGHSVGRVTSAAKDHASERTSLLAAIRWDARDGLLRSDSGVALRPVG